MTAPAFVADLQGRGLSLALSGDALRVVGPKALLTDDLRAQLAALKPDLLAYLSRPQEQEAATAKPVNVNRDLGNVSQPERPSLADCHTGATSESLAASPAPQEPLPDSFQPVPIVSGNPRRWEYLREWLGAVYFYGGTGIGNFPDLPDAERAECRQRGEAWFKGSTGRDETQELAQWVGCSVAELQELLQRLRQCEKPLAAPLPSLPIVPRITAWPDDVQQHIDWFNSWEGTSQPFTLYPWIKITDPSVYFASLRADLSAGPRGTRARYGAVQDDLQRLYELFGTESKRDS
jgi:hypothetical protein